MGLRQANEELLLIKTKTGAPVWQSVRNKAFSLHEADMRHHISVLIDKH
jgi:hypothetical protein